MRILYIEQIVVTMVDDAWCALAHGAVALSVKINDDIRRFQVLLFLVFNEIVVRPVEGGS